MKSNLAIKECTCNHSILTNKEKRLSLWLVKKIDPSRTLPIKEKFIKDLEKRFNWLIQLIEEGVGRLDLLNLNPEGLVASELLLPDDALAQLRDRSFQFTTSSKKVEGFMNWLGDMEEIGVLETATRTGITRFGKQPWSDIYIQSSYQKGILRARQEMKKAGVDITQLDPDPNREMEILFNGSFHSDRAGLLYTRTFNQLKGITNSMDRQISSVLAQGITDGKGSREVARDLVDRVKKIGITRARTLARTEIQRAHHEANMNEYESAGLDGVVVRVEWTTSVNPCPICASLEGSVYAISEARGLIPAHPNCSCVFIPFQPGIDKVKPAVPGAFGWIPDCASIPHDILPTILSKDKVFVVMAAKSCLTTGDKSKVKRALKSHLPATKEVQQLAIKNERLLAKYLKGGKQLKDNEPFDVIVGSRKNPKHLIEVKTIIRGKNNKITMHKGSLKRKKDFAKLYPDAKVHTVVFDNRIKGGKIYHADGVASFRLKNMIEFKSRQKLGKFIETGEVSKVKKVIKPKVTPKKVIPKKPIPKKKPKIVDRWEKMDLESLKTPSKSPFFKDYKLLPQTENFVNTKEELEILKNIGRNIDDLFNRFPSLKKYNTSYSNLKIVDKETLVIGRKVKGSFSEKGLSIELVTKDISMKHTLSIGEKSMVISQDFFSNLRHELGHKLLNKSTTSEGWINLFNNTDEIKKISKYALTNKKEAMAEAFSAYTSPLYKKGMLSKKIEEILEELIL